MQSQHYVPQIYLRNFCAIPQEGFLYASRFIDQAEKWTTPRSYHVSNVCCAEDFYNIDQDTAATNGIQENYIEVFGFQYERFFISEITQKLINRKIDREDIYKFCRFHLSMKHRNPKFREGYIGKIEENLPSSEEAVREKFLSLGYPLEKINLAIELSRKKILSDPDKEKTHHNRILLENTQGVTPSVLAAFNKLIQYDIIIYEITDPDKFFIITDNPGYSVDLKGETYNVKFKDDYYHVMPMTSKISVIFHKPENEKDTLKNIRWVTISDKVLDTLNLNCAIFRNDFIYCENQSYLKDFINRLG